MAASYKDIIAHLDAIEADVLARKQDVLDRQAVMKEEILKNIKDARNILAFVNEKMQSTKDKKLLSELDGLREQLEEVITTNENILKDYC